MMLSFAGSAGIGTLQFLLSVLVAGFLFPVRAATGRRHQGFLFRVVPEQSELFLSRRAPPSARCLQGVIGVAIVQSLLAGIGFKLPAHRAPDCRLSSPCCCRSCKSVPLRCSSP